MFGMMLDSFKKKKKTAKENINHFTSINEDILKKEQLTEL